MKTLKDFDFENKRVLVRCDFNVPLDKRGNILDDFRIKQVIPTISYLIEKKAKIILMSHLGDPGGKAAEGLRLDPVQGKLMEYLDFSITKAPDCIGQEAKEWVNNIQPGEILLLENLRFHKEEEENNQNFARELAESGEIYVNEAFSCSHRAHASIVGVPEFLPSAMGLIFEKEIDVLGRLLKNPQRPFVAIVGGKKVETKAKFLDKLCEIADWVLTGGKIEVEIKEKRFRFSCPEKIINPVDDIDTFDIGPKTVEIFKEKIIRAKTVFWVGPLGMIENEKYVSGSKEIAKAIAESGSFSIVGGGDTVEFINGLGIFDKFSYVSTGGGATLAFLSEGTLPGIEALNN
ncbi:MAG: phosphoglycerate kinase [Patescibacteria group bacterium]